MHIINEENQWSICNLYYFICLHVSCFPFRCVFYQIAGHIFHGSGIVQCAIKQISFSIWFFIYDNCETVTDIRRKIPSFQLTIAWLFFVRFIFEDARQFSCALQFYKMDNCLHPEINARSLCNFLHKNAHCNSDNLCDFDSFSWNPIGNLDLRK